MIGVGLLLDDGVGWRWVGVVGLLLGGRGSCGIVNVAGDVGGRVVVVMGR